MKKENIEKIIYLLGCLDNSLNKLSIYEIPEFKKIDNVLNIGNPNVNTLKMNLDFGFRRLYEMGIYNDDVSFICEEIYQALKYRHE